MADFYAARKGCARKSSFAPASGLGGSKMTVTEEPIDGAKSVGCHGISFNNLGSRYSSRYLAQGVAVVRPGKGWRSPRTIPKGLPGLARPTAAAAGITRPRPAFPALRHGGCTAQPDTSTRYHDARAARGESQARSTSRPSMARSFLRRTRTARWSFTESFTHTTNVVAASTISRSRCHGPVLQLPAVPGRISASRSRFSVKTRSFGAGLTVSQGISPRTGTFSPAGPGGCRPPLHAGSGATLGYNQSLPNGYSAALTWNGQWADATLPQNQQWVLGGFGNLTAWLPAVLVGDNGMLARASVSSPPGWLGRNSA